MLPKLETTADEFQQHLVLQDVRDKSWLRLLTMFRKSFQAVRALFIEGDGPFIDWSDILKSLPWEDDSPEQIKTGCGMITANLATSLDEMLRIERSRAKPLPFLERLDKDFPMQFMMSRHLEHHSLDKAELVELALDIRTQYCIAKLQDTPVEGEDYPGPLHVIASVFGFDADDTGVDPEDWNLRELAFVDLAPDRGKQTAKARQKKRKKDIVRPSVIERIQAIIRHLDEDGTAVDVYALAETFPLGSTANRFMRWENAMYGLTRMLLDTNEALAQAEVEADDASESSASGLFVRAEEQLQREAEEELATQRSEVIAPAISKST
jgi:hypothetical protein